MNPGVGGGGREMMTHSRERLADLVRDVVPVEVERLHVAALRQDEHRQVVTRSAGKEKDGRRPQRRRLAHRGPLVAGGGKRESERRRSDLQEWLGSIQREELRPSHCVHAQTN